MRFLTNEEMIAEAHRCHHFCKAPPMESWLNRSQEPLDSCRLKAIGNVVIPRVASLACQILGRFYTQSFWWFWCFIQVSFFCWNFVTCNLLVSWWYDFTRLETLICIAALTAIGAGSSHTEIRCFFEPGILLQVFNGGATGMFRIRQFWNQILKLMSVAVETLQYINHWACRAFWLAYALDDRDLLWQVHVAKDHGRREHRHLWWTLTCRKNHRSCTSWTIPHANKQNFFTFLWVVLRGKIAHARKIPISSCSFELRGFSSFTPDATDEEWQVVEEEPACCFRSSQSQLSFATFQFPVTARTQLQEATHALKQD